MKYFFTENGNIQHSTGSPVSGGTFTITTSPSSKLKVSTWGVYAGPLAITFSGGNMPGMVPGSVSGTGTIFPTSLKNRTGGLFVVLVGDSGSLIGVAQPVGSPPPPPVPVNIPCECSDGQNKVRGE